jgi:hypothetical protein
VRASAKKHRREKAATGLIVMCDFAADLVDHQPFDRTNALTVGAINGRSLRPLSLAIRFPVSRSL